MPSRVEGERGYDPARRITGRPGLSLRRMAEHESQGARCPDGAALIAMMRAELPLLNEVRAGIASAG